MKYMDMAVRKMELILVQTAVLLLIAMVHRVEGAVDARTEQVAYVGENAVLGCPLTESYTVSYPNWKTLGVVTIYAWSGKIIPLYAHRVSYYTDNTSLVINNITLSDAGSYSCSADIYGIIREGINTLHTRIRPQPPVISNRQSDGSVIVTEGQPLTLTCTSRGGNPAPTVTWFRGSTARTNSNSGPLEGDGYTVTATYTFSPTSSYDGSIYICQTSYTSPKLDVLDSVNATLRLNLRPQPPVISNRQSDGSVTGTEGQPLTLTCTSRGGDPAPTVTWYRGSTQSTALISSNSVPLVGDGYTVTATHTFTPTSADDGSIYICQTSYTSPTLDVLDSVNATLRLNLKPSQPTVVQDGDVVAGSTVTVHCTTSGFRPEAIAISWTYKGGDYSQSATTTTTQTGGTDTYTTTSTLQFTVQKVDNGGTAKCIVAHSTLGTSLTGTATIDVHYKPESATVTGNHVILANGANPLTLTCVVGVGNPAATTISWTRTSRTGTVYPVSTQNTLVLRPRRDDDGDTVTCTADNGIGSVTSGPATLDLQLKPSQPTVVQDGDVVVGSTVIVRCTTSGFRPEAIAISWTYNGGDYSQSANTTTTQTGGTDTYTTTSTLQFTVQKVDNGGTAKCIVAHSTLGTSLTGTATIDVHYKPESATVTGNHEIVASGVNTLTLTCNVGVGNPAATTISWTRTSRTGTVYPVSTQNPLVLTPTRDDDGDTVTCTADNGIGSVTSGPATLDRQYHPITTITVSPTGAVTEGPTDVTLQCSAHSKPAATITWYHNGGTLQGAHLSTTAHNTYVSTYKITVSRQDFGEYKCIATNTVSQPTGDTSNTAVVTLDVNFPPQSAIIEGNREIEADGQNQLELKCVVGESNPMSAISWSKTGKVDIGTTHAMQDATGSYGGYTRSQVLELTPTRDNDGDTITCTAGNGVGQSVTRTITLNLKYSAIASIVDETLIEGANSKDLTCNANSKPAATFTWYKGTSSTVPLVSGPGTGSGNQWTSTYTISGVGRSHAGRYRCVAYNGVGASDEKTMTLIVYYPPDVTATAQLNNGQLVATCSPSGVPDSYHYSNWVHLWSDGTRISQTPPLAATQTLLLTHLTYHDSGIYTCGAGNGVGLNGAMSANYIKQGSTSVINIESLPIIIGPAEQKVPIILHEPTTVSITYYSNVADSTAVTCHRVVDNITQPQSVGVVTTETSPIQLPVYESVVSEQGTSATVNLTLKTKDELGSYVVKITNTVGTAVVHLLALPEGPPEMPIYPRVEAVYTTSVNVSWELGYHGGLGQIFIIQYSIDGKTWTDGATLDTGNSTSRDRHYVTVDSLSPGTLYSVRIYANNNHGKSLDTAMINVTTSTIGADRRTSSSVVGPAVGGSAAALIVIALVVGLVVLHRKGYSIMRPCTEKSNTYRDHTHENEVVTNETRHEMCQARAASPTRDEGQAAALSYERLTSTRVTTSAMYDELNITGAGLVGDTTRDGSVAGPYETLEPRQGENESIYEELRPRDDQMMEYENLKIK